MSPRAGRALAIAALAVGAMVWAWSRAWVCDDAFITWRYAENLGNGLGAVYNAGERVEGYSNPSWMLLAALAIRLGLDPVAFGQWLGIVCYGALVPATAWAAQRFRPDGAAAAFLPLAAVGVALHRHLCDFASCGLETLGFVLLVTLIAGVLARARSAGDFMTASVFTVLAAVTRPDGALVGALAGLVAVIASVRQRSLGPVVGFALPGFLLFLPFLAWRWLYYDDLLPNTFYAKSAYDPYGSRGWFYVRLYLSAYYVLWPALAAVLALPFVRGCGSVWRLAVLVSGYLAFVVWVGGDFMFARFCLPVTPLCYIALEVAARRFLPLRAGWGALAVVAATTLVLHERADLCIPGRPLPEGIADERAQYPPQRTAAIRAAGRRLGELTRGTDLRVAFSGTQAMLIYDAKVSYALEAVTGLTDRFLARQELAVRGHVGHEKGIFSSDAAREYALRSQGVHLLLFDWPQWTAKFPFLKVAMAGFDFTLVRWDREIMSRLIAAPDVAAVDLERYLDDYVAALPQRPRSDAAEVAIDLAAFEFVYFRWHDDAARKQPIVRWLAEHR
ncbi:MAG: hypothetical protein KDE27_07245 [Planctomycetes bacterium]|nr:hypothetical protein [Planctomycetota bacterium]